MRDEWSVAALLESAARGVEPAWREIIRRHSSLVSSVCRRHGIFGAEAEDVSGNVWLRLVAKLTTIRQPAALPGWLATTTRRECLMLLRDKDRQVPHDDGEIASRFEPDVDASLLVDERRDALRDALALLPKRDLELLSMLFTDPPIPYAEISSSLGMPIGAIGPNRQRCLARMRRTPAIAALLVDGPHVRSA